MDTSRKENESHTGGEAGQEANGFITMISAGSRTGKVVTDEQGASAWRESCKRTGSTV